MLETASEKRDLIRYIGEKLYDLYTRKVLSVSPTYDLTIVHDETNIKKAVMEFFIQPYYDLLDYRESLGEDSIERLNFDARYPNLEHEAGEVAARVGGFIREYIEKAMQSEAQRDMLYRMYVDKDKRVSIQKQIEQFGRTEIGKRND